MYRLGQYSLDLRQQVLFRDGERVHLAKKPYLILVYLVENRDRLVSRRELLDHFWDGKDVYDQTLTKAVGRIRKVLGESNGESQYLETRWASGYRYIGPFEHVSGNGSRGDAAPARDSATTGSGTVADSGTPIAATPAAAVPNSKFSRFLTRRIAAIALLVATVSVAGGWGLRHGLASPVSPIKLRQSVAVLGFENLSGRPDSAWLSTALSEMLTTEIESAGDLRTIPGESVARTKTDLNLASVNGLSRDTLGRVRTSLGADLVVTGGYTLIASPPPAAEQLRLDVRIQDARSGDTLASSATTGTIANLFSLIGQASSDLRRVARAGGPPAAAAQARASMPSNPEAARLYSEGLARLRSFDALAARDRLQQAVVFEPAFPLSHAALAEAWSILGYHVNSLDEAKTAFDLSANLSSEERQLIEAAYRRAAAQWDASVSVYSDLFRRYPDNVDYGLRLAEVQRLGAHGREALVTISTLKALPHPLSADPRIALEQARIQHFLADDHAAVFSAAEAIRQARSINAQLFLARALQMLSEINFNLGSQSQAKDAAEEARVLCERLGDPSCLSDAYISLAKSQSLTSNAESLPDRRKGYQVALEHGLDGQAAAALNDIGTSLFFAGQLAEAEKDYRQASELFTKINDKVGLLRTTINRGNVAFRTGNLREADNLYRQAVAISDSAGQRNYYMMSLANLGNVEELEGNLPAAMQDFQKSLQATRDMGIDGAWPLASIGELLYLEADFATAQRTLEQALPPKRSGGHGFLGFADVDLAGLQLDQGNFAAAENLARETAADAANKQDADLEARATELLARALLAEGKLAEARQAIEHAATLLQPPFADDASLEIAITSARVSAASSGYSPAAVQESLRRLQKIISTAQSQGQVMVRMEAVLAKSQIQLTSGQSAAARPQLLALSREASQKNFGLLQRRSEALLASPKPTR